MSEQIFKFENSYAALPDRFYSRLSPVAVAEPSLIRVNAPLADALGFDADLLSGAASVEVLAGNRVPGNADPIALAYAGHQFGNFVPQLGDGRAILLGEVVGPDGIRRDLQLKGSGQTPYSRMGDGRAALGPILREYLVSEHMHALGIPTTRALAAIRTGEQVFREKPLPGAVLTRVAQSHIRVGTFEYFASRRDTDALETLTAYALDRHYPDHADDDNKAAALLRAVAERQADLLARWLAVGFIHGVMNTDNTSIAGETIDYGPCAFMDTYHPEKVFSSIDHMGRYAFMRQPAIMQWNLAQLANALIPAIDETPEKAVEIATEIVEDYPKRFEAHLTERFSAKLGLATEQPGDLSLALDLLEIMATEEADFTLTFRDLSERVGERDDDAAAFKEWLGRWRARLMDEGISPEDAALRLKTANPAVIARNHLVEAAIRAAEDDEDLAPFNDLCDALVRPFEDRAGDSKYTEPPLPEQVVRQTFCGT